MHILHCKDYLILWRSIFYSFTVFLLHAFFLTASISTTTHNRVLIRLWVVFCLRCLSFTFYCESLWYLICKRATVHKSTKSMFLLHTSYDSFEGFLPAGVWSRFEASLSVGLPHAVGELVANCWHDLDELERPLVQVQRANPGQVGAQVSVDARALDADQGPEVQTGPVWVWRRHRDDVKGPVQYF